MGLNFGTGILFMVKVIDTFQALEAVLVHDLISMHANNIQVSKLTAIWTRNIGDYSDMIPRFPLARQVYELVCKLSKNYLKFTGWDNVGTKTKDKAVTVSMIFICWGLF